MKTKTISIMIAVSLLATVFLVASVSAAGNNDRKLPIPVEITSRLKDRQPPKQLSPAEAASAVALTDTTESQCFGDDSTLTITIPSFSSVPEDPPLEQDVVFWKETADTSTSNATLWVAWDFLTTEYGHEDVITCDQLAYLQGSMDDIVDTDVEYFGEYVNRPAENPNIDVMIYNIVDENYFDEEFPFYIAGFFWSNLNDDFNRNMIFIDTWDWESGLGPDAEFPYLYEGTVAHEMEHLIHRDHDPDEDLWIDEGLADLAIYFNGFGHDAGHVVYYLAYHRTSLTLWGSLLEDYGASYLFQLYLLEQYGSKNGDKWAPQWTKAILNEQANGIAGVENLTGANFNDLYDSWVLANYMDDPTLSGAGGFPLGYDEIDLNPFISDNYSPWSIKRGVSDIYGGDHQGNLPISRYYGGYVSGSVEYPQGELPPYTPLYSTYKGLQPNMAVEFAGESQSGVSPYAGSYEAAGGGGHLLTDRMLELTVPVSGTLSFWTWYDIEEDWDYGFVEVSDDGGTTWMPISGTITAFNTNPNNSTAWANSLVSGQDESDSAITGNSGGWVSAEFDLGTSDVLVRFAYYTDEAVNGQGWFIDEVSANGLSDGFESGAGNWDLGGWEWTTGLFDNHWMAAYVNPVYYRGHFYENEYGYMPTFLSGSGLYELAGGVLDTSRLGKDEAMVVIANRPVDSPFASFYQLLAYKLSAAN